MKLYSLLNESLESGYKIALVTVLSSSCEKELPFSKAILNEQELIGADSADLTVNLITAAAWPLLAHGESKLLDLEDQSGGRLKLFVHTLNPLPRLIIFGGGHVGGALAKIASFLDFTVIIVDDRPSFANHTAHPLADQVICRPFAEAFKELKPGVADYLVIVTRGHQYDRLCLEKSLERDWAYLGMIGSRRRVRAQLDDLALSGYPQEKLDQVRTPIGLAIGAVTEAEIAISILAEVIQVRRSKNSAEVVQSAVIKELVRVEVEKETVVLATIVKTGGSTPRKAGSQMLVFPEGSLVGTVGGGCSEAEVRREALNCFDRQESRSLKLNLTADAAAEEGMACGGVMELYLEFITFAA